ncbi:MAG: TetR family transcriptional regulator [Frankiales bacterium]|nr:TetR family transcriptional regulator [Frankiales bacterium]
MAAARPLSRELILDTAFALADREGIESVTMRAVAAKLGVEAMSLYHHVPNKKAILDGVVDLLVKVAALPTGPVTAEEWIRGAAAGLRALAQQHPRLVPLFSLRALPLDDPGSAAPFEAGIAAFCAAGHTLADAYANLQVSAIALLAMTQFEATAILHSDTADESALATLNAEQFPLLQQIPSLPTGVDDFWSALVEGLVAGFAA